MTYDWHPESPLWVVGTLSNALELDARKVKAGGDVMVTMSAYGLKAAVEPEDLDSFARAWLAFRDTQSEAGTHAPQSGAVLGTPENPLTLNEVARIAGSSKRPPSPRPPMFYNGGATQQPELTEYTEDGEPQIEHPC